MDLSLLQKIAIAILPILFAVTLHEAAHGYAALLCGDKTAKYTGRLSLNPTHHIDLIGTIVVPIITLMIGGILFGWAKPVPYEPRNFKNPKRDIIFVALAGPAANLVMAIIWAAISKLGINLGANQGGVPLALSLMGQYGLMINLFIMLFNLIPIPPLDGSRVIATLLSGKIAYRYYQIAPYGFFILLALIIIGALNYIIGVPFMLLQNSINSLFGLL